MSRIYAPLLLSAFLTASVHAQSRLLTVTFDGPPPQPPGTQYAISQYTESGMLFKPLGSLDPIAPYRLGRCGGGISFYPENGTAYLQTLFGDSLEFCALDGSPFDLISVDLAEYSIYFTTPTVTFQGLRADGTTASATMNVGPLSQFQTFYFNPGFTNMIDVQVTDQGYSLDNVVLHVPEPSTALLLIAGSAVWLRAKLWKTRRRD